MAKKSIPERSIEHQLLFQAFEKTAVGDILTYGRIKEITGRDAQNGGRGIIYSVARRLLRELKIVIGCVENEGYKVLNDEGIVDSSFDGIKRIRKMSARGARKLVCVKDYDSLPREKQVAHNINLSVLGVLHYSSGTRVANKIAAKVEESATRLSLQKTLELMR